MPKTAWYKNRNNALVDLQDRVVGHCDEEHLIFAVGGVKCVFGDNDDLRVVVLHPYLWCTTNVFHT